MSERRRAWTTWATSRLLAVVATVLLVEFGGSNIQSDVRGVYFQAAAKIFHGAVPYVNFKYEYPPGTLPFVMLGWLLGGHGEKSFEGVWVVFMLALDAAVLVALRALATERNRPAAEAVWLAGGLLTPWFVLHNDLVVVAPVVVAMALTARRPLAAGAVWAFASMAKLWPAAPTAAIAVARAEGRGRFVAGAVAVGAVTAGVLGAFGALHAMVRVLVDYQGHRPIEIESTWANFRWLHAALDGTHLRTVAEYGSVNLVGGHSMLMATLGYDLTSAASVLLIVGALAIRYRTGRALTAATWSWLLSAYVALTLLLAPVFSPQYISWLIGAAAVTNALDSSRAARALGAVSVLAGLASTLEYALKFGAMINGDSWTIVDLTIRNLAVAAAFGCAVRGLRGVLAPARHPHVFVAATEVSTP